MKVVINKCYGGFSLSHEGIMHYAKLKGITLYPEEEHFKFKTYWTIPKDQRPVKPDFDTGPLEERAEYNRTYIQYTLWDDGIERNDPCLVSTVEELGKKANGRYANLSVVEIPDNIAWEILEYDGNEWVAEKHRTWS
jgi:hypothetical protein